MNETLAEYSARYLEQYAEGGFETVLVRIRREQVLAFLRQYRPRRIIELGCGLEPLFSFYADFERMVVVEPSAEFVSSARQVAGADARIEILQGYAEELAS